MCQRTSIIDRICSSKHLTNMGLGPKFDSPRMCPSTCPLSRWCHPTISNPLSPSSLSVFYLSQNQGLFQWVSCSHQVAKVLELQLQLQHQSFQRVFRVDFLLHWLVWSPFFPRDSQESPTAPEFENINSLVCCLLHKIVDDSPPYPTLPVN